jgi:hypothetical protein
LVVPKQKAMKKNVIDKLKESKVKVREEKI